LSGTLVDGHTSGWPPCQQSLVINQPLVSLWARNWRSITAALVEDHSIGCDLAAAGRSVLVKDHHTNNAVHGCWILVLNGSIINNESMNTLHMSHLYMQPTPEECQNKCKCSYDVLQST